MAERYVRSHGPVTEKDLAGWLLKPLGLDARGARARRRPARARGGRRADLADARRRPPRPRGPERRAPAAAVGRVPPRLQVARRHPAARALRQGRARAATWSSSRRSSSTARSRAPGAASGARRRVLVRGHALRPARRGAVARGRDGGRGIRPLRRQPRSRSCAARDRLSGARGRSRRRRCRRATASTPSASVCRRAGRGRRLRDHLVERLAAGLTADEVDRMLAAGEFVDADGRAGASRRAVRAAVGRLGAPRPAGRGAAARRTSSVLHRDERLVVVDKPHHMATMPRGRHVVQSALARTRVLTGPAPAHARRTGSTGRRRAC